MTDHPYSRVHAPAADGELFLADFVCREGLSQIAEYELSLSSHNDDLQADALLGQPMTLYLGLAQHEERVLQGYITAFSAQGRVERMARYQVSLRPWLWFLTQSSHHRIFENLTLEEVLKEVLKDYPATVDWQFERQAPMAYCVQFAESDFAFFSRLLEAAGLYYFFAWQAGEQRLVIVDSMSAHPRVQPFDELSYRPNQQDVLASMSAWESQGEWVPGAVSLGDFDFTKASTRDASVLSAVHRDPAPYDQANYRQAVFPGRFSDASSGDALARMHLESLQALGQWTRGTSPSPYLVPGQCFSLIDHPLAAQNTDYLIVRATLQFERGTTPRERGASGLRCQVEAIATSRVFRAPIRTPRPVIAGPQTAFVVGKAGEQVWVDEYGRIKVQFHWDNSGRQNENCSCWVRVAQPIAGKRWGGLFLPRVGQEVVVEFLDGNPDRPLVTGGLYNSGHRPPWDLPSQSARSGFKSQSLGGNGVYNEVRFEDQADGEQLLMHAGRNLDLTVRNDTFASIGNDCHRRVGAHQFLKVEADLHESVGGDRNGRIEANHSLDIGGDSHCKVAGRLLSTASGIDFKADGSIVLEAGKSLTLKVGGSTVVLSASGIALNGTMVSLDGATGVDINGGNKGAAASAKAASPTSATAPKEADDGAA